MTALRNFFITLLLSLLIFGVLGYVLVGFVTSAFELDSNEGITTDKGEDTVIVTDGSGGQIVIDKNEWNSIKGESFTVMLVGTDYQPSFYDDYDVSEENKNNDGFPVEPRQVETDSVIVVRINKETGTAVFCAIPTDMKIKVEGLDYRLRELYALKGIAALKSKVTALTGLRIDYYAMINIDNFIKVIDSLGGITYYVETDMHYVNEEKGLNIDLRKGSQKLNGKKALDMLRYCEYGDGEVSRRKCAVTFIEELLKKVIVSNNYANASVLYSKYKGYFETDFSLNDLTNNVDLIFALSKMNITEYVYPGTSTGTGSNTTFTPNTTKAISDLSAYKSQG